MKYIFRRTYRKPLTWTALRLVSHVWNCFQYKIVSSGLSTVAQSSEVLTQQNRKLMMQTLWLLVCENKLWKHYTHNGDSGRGKQKRNGPDGVGSTLNTQWTRRWANSFPITFRELWSCGTHRSVYQLWQRGPSFTRTITFYLQKVQQVPWLILLLELTSLCLFWNISIFILEPQQF